MTSYHDALHKCAERYRDMQADRGIATDDPLWVFTMEFMFKCRDGYPVPKLCRWLGYIQGTLIARGFTTVTVERDWTRPLFRPLDFPDETRTCVLCGETKPATEFSDMHDGKQCKECRKWP